MYALCKAQGFAAQLVHAFKCQSQSEEKKARVIHANERVLSVTFSEEPRMTFCQKLKYSNMVYFVEWACKMIHIMILG